MDDKFFVYHVLLRELVGVINPNFAQALLVFERRSGEANEYIKKLSNEIFEQLELLRRDIYRG